MTASNTSIYSVQRIRCCKHPRTVNIPQAELVAYLNKFINWEGNLEPDMIIETDTSMLQCCVSMRTGVFWSQMENQNHINYLELMAATFVVKSFAKLTKKC